jgi:Flp pilus assembly pilin Flp
MLKHFWKDQQGATMAEYALLIALVAGVVFAIIQTFGSDIKEIFTTSTEQLEEAADGMD